MKKNLHRLLYLPLALHLAVGFATATVAFYTHAFTGEAVWLVYSWAPHPFYVFHNWVGYTLVLALGSIPLIVKDLTRS